MVAPMLSVAVVILWLSHFLVTTRGLVNLYSGWLPPAASWYNLWLPRHSYNLLVYVPESPARSSYPQSRALSRSLHFGYSSYNGPDVWPLEYPQCSGARQSPINLESDDMYRLLLPEQLRWHGYWDRPRNLTLRNNGHTIQVSGSWELVPSISGGPLEGEYVFSQLHFHWGTSDNIGSEHTVSNFSFPMEMHLVHYKKNYGSQEVALNYGDGLAVVSFLYEVNKEMATGDHLPAALLSLCTLQLSERPNPALNAIIPFLDSVVGAELEVTVARPFPLEMLDISFSSEYVTYLGSLTTPPCSEVVTWIVSSRPLALSQEQLAKFRHLSSADVDMENNFRPVQPTNGRPVYYVS